MTVCTLQPSVIGSTIRHECGDYDWDELDDYGESPMDYCQACQDGVATWSRLDQILRFAKDDESVDVEAAIVGTATIPFTMGEIELLKNGNDPFMRMMILDPYRGLERSWFDYDCLWREQQGLPMSWEEGPSDEWGFTFDTAPRTVPVSQSDKAAEMYTDWDEPDEGWPEGVRKRCGRPWVYYRKQNIWVPTSHVFRFSPHAYIATNEVEKPKHIKSGKTRTTAGVQGDSRTWPAGDQGDSRAWPAGDELQRGDTRSWLASDEGAKHQGDTIRGFAKAECRSWTVPEEEEEKWVKSGGAEEKKSKSKSIAKVKAIRDPIERTLQFIIAEEKKAPAAVAAAAQPQPQQPQPQAEDSDDDDLSRLAFFTRRR